MEKTEIVNLIIKIIMASFAAVGLLEYLKNFIKTDKTWIYSLIMPFLAVGSFFAIEFLPESVIGGVITIGCVQLDYQLIIQGFKKLLNKSIKKNIDNGVEE